ncbi:MAG: M1 family metallopeptidase, partial [bacterium]
MKHMPPRLILLLLLLPVMAQAQVKTVTYVRDPNSDPTDLVGSLKHVEADLHFIPEEWKVLGEAVLTFIPNRYQTDSLVFYAPGFSFISVRLEHKEIPSRIQGNNLIIYPGPGLQKDKVYKLTMRYESSPVATGIYFVGWKPEETGKRKQIWAHRPFGWLPYMDGRVTMDLRITFDDDFTVFTNGEKISVKENPDETKTWHYRMVKDHPYFSTALGIGDYQVALEKTSRGIPLELLYYEGMEEKVEPTYRYTKEMFDFFEREMGVPYPYPVYREIPVIDYMYGGMECTTSTIFGDYMLIDPRAYWQRNYINVNAHELAHQWFGDYIGHLAHKDVWLTESFGTYYAKLFERSVFGEEDYENSMREEREQALEASRQNNFPVGGSQGGRARIYQKGSLVLGMLRDMMGDREFQDAIKAYLQKFGFASAETPDFIRSVYNTTGRSFNWFFDEWVLRPGEPHYRISYRILDEPSGMRNTYIRVEQIQEITDLTGLFTMPIWFQVWYADGTHDSTRAWIQDKTQEIVVPNPGKKQVDFVLFDPGCRVLKQVTFDKSFEELSSQALRAPSMIDRHDALTALRDVPAGQKRNLLIQCYDREDFHLTKSEILHQLTKDSCAETTDLFRKAIYDPDAKVREAVLLVLNPVPAGLQTDAESLLGDFSYLNVELALDRMCHDFSADAGRYLELTKHETGWRGKNIRMKWLLISIENGKQDLLP